MHKFQEIQEQALQDATSIIARLSNVTTAEELIKTADDVAELQELISFLHKYERYSSQIVNSGTEDTDNQSTSLNFGQNEEVPAEDTYIAEDEVIFNNNFNQIEDAEIHHPEINDDVLEEEAIFNNELNEIEDTLSAPIATDNEYETSEEDNGQLGEERQEIEEAGNDGQDTDLAAVEEIPPRKEVSHPELRGKIVDFEHEQKMQELNEAAALLQEQHEEKKFKLSSIKGLKKIQSLFDDDPLDEIMKEEHTAPPAAGSLRKSNIPTDFMEAEKPKNEFKLDLNDKIAFSKMLFGGSQSKLNETITALNGFRTLEEAREYLSEAYYEHKWDKSDEYAQRLWSLVENKFL